MPRRTRHCSSVWSMRKRWPRFELQWRNSTAVRAAPPVRRLNSFAVVSDSNEILAAPEQSLRAVEIAALREELHRPDPRIRALAAVARFGCVPALPLLVVGAPVCWAVGGVWGTVWGPTHF